MYSYLLIFYSQQFLDSGLCGLGLPACPHGAASGLQFWGDSGARPRPSDGTVARYGAPFVMRPCYHHLTATYCYLYLLVLWCRILLWKQRGCDADAWPCHSFRTAKNMPQPASCRFSRHYRTKPYHTLLVAWFLLLYSFQCFWCHAAGIRSFTSACQQTNRCRRDAEMFGLVRQITGVRFKKSQITCKMMHQSQVISCGGSWWTQVIGPDRNDDHPHHRRYILLLLQSIISLL